MNDQLESLYMQLIDAVTALALTDDAIVDAHNSNDSQKHRALLTTRKELQAQINTIKAQIQKAERR